MFKYVIHTHMFREMNTAQNIILVDRCAARYRDKFMNIRTGSTFADVFVTANETFHTK
jgi:hypothetical protein